MIFLTDIIRVLGRMPHQTDHSDRYGCQPRTRWSAGAINEGLSSEVEDANDIGQKTQLEPAGLGEMIACEQTGNPNGEVPGCECSSAQVRNGRGCAGSYLVGRRWFIDSLQVGGILIALRGVYDGCQADLGKR